jgi:hypothetical protein
MKAQRNLWGWQTPLTLQFSEAWKSPVPSYLNGEVTWRRTDPEMFHAFCLISWRCHPLGPIKPLPPLKAFQKSNFSTSDKNNNVKQKCQCLLFFFLLLGSDQRNRLYCCRSTIEVLLSGSRLTAKMRRSWIRLMFFVSYIKQKSKMCLDCKYVIKKELLIK